MVVISDVRIMKWIPIYFIATLIHLFINNINYEENARFCSSKDEARFDSYCLYNNASIKIYDGKSGCSLKYGSNVCLYDYIVKDVKPFRPIYIVADIFYTSLLFGIIINFFVINERIKHEQGYYLQQQHALHGDAGRQSLTAGQTEQRQTEQRQEEQIQLQVQQV